MSNCTKYNRTKFNLHYYGKDLFILQRVEIQFTELDSVFFFPFLFEIEFRLNEFPIMLYFRFNRGKGPIMGHRAQMFLRNCIGC